MKKIILSLSICFAALTSFASGGAEISFDTIAHDFGLIPTSGVEHNFNFTNTGSAPLVIISSDAGCECTKSYIPEEPIMPGKSNQIRVTYEPKEDAYGSTFNKSITVKSNAAENGFLILTIKGTVENEPR